MIMLPEKFAIYSSENKDPRLREYIDWIRKENQFFKMKEEKEFIPVVGKEYYFADIESKYNYNKSIFLGKSLDGLYIAQYNERSSVNTWKYCFPIPEEETLELTLEEIAEKFNVDVNNLKIKK